jgi:DNA transposition AAA+ family ATPase
LGVVDPATNPYSPGAGRPPAALVGRDPQLQAWRVALERVAAGRTSQSLVLYGLRGVGKTVLLAQLAKNTREREWIVARVEAGSGKGLREMLGEALHGPLSDLARPSAGQRLRKALKTALSFKASYDISGKWTFGLDLSEIAGGGADTGTLETDLTKLFRDLTAGAQEENLGVAILIDEVQDLSPEELTAVCTTVHLGGQEGWPFLVALAGLPSTPRVLSEARSYSERLFRFERIAHLDEDVAREAIEIPAQEEGVQWEEEAVAWVVKETTGYPYFLQQFGQEAWDQATGQHIMMTDARVGAEVAKAALDNGFFRSRWDRAARAEKHYLRAIAEDGDVGSSSGEVAKRLDRSPKSLGPARASLMGKGLIYAPVHGMIAFTVPGMADFIIRQPL